jgi:hypothetical protein
MTDDLRPAVRALLAEPLVDRSDPTTLALVRRYRAELTRWFADELGYRLDASRPSVARLAKLPGAGHAPRGLHIRASHRPFDRRRYALVCLVLAAVEAAGERCTLARTFEEVAARAAGIEGLAFDPEVGADRRVFIQAVQAVVDLGVLERAEGDEERFARGEQGGRRPLPHRSGPAGATADGSATALPRWRSRRAGIRGIPGDRRGARPPAAPSRDASAARGAGDLPRRFDSR